MAVEHELTITTVSLTDLVPDPANARRHDQRNLDAIRGSLARWGQVEPIVVQKGTRRIVGGHGRIEALRALGKTHAAVVEIELDSTEATALAIALNRTAELASWDDEVLAALLESLPDGMAQVAGFTDEELSAMLAALVPPVEVVEDEVPEPPDDPVTRPGELILLGDHRLVCGDCRDRAVLTLLMEGHAADLLLTDPPYGVSYVGKTKDALTIENDAIEGEAFGAFLAEAFTSADAVMAAGGAFYIWHADSEGLTFRRACADAGWRVRQCLVWAKNVMVMGRQDYHWKHEPCLYGWKDGASHRWYGGRTQTTLLEFDRPSRSEQHPTMKPVALFAHLIENSTKKGELVLDMFLGSGTSIIAAEQLGRRCYGTELDARYCDVIVQRWETFTGRKAERG